MNTILKGVKFWDHKKQAWSTVDVDVEIDLPLLAAQLVQKASRNKTRKSRALHSAVIVTIRS